MPKTERLLWRGGEFVDETKYLVNPGLSRESPQRSRLKGHPQIIQALGRLKRALGEVDLNAEVGTEEKKEVPRPSDLELGGAKDQPIVQIPKNAVTRTMHGGGDRGHDTYEDKWCG